MKFLTILLTFLALVYSSVALKNAVCDLEHSVNGNGLIACAAFRPSWSYNSEAKQCVEFIYGGCGGNDNRFDSKDTCEQTCKE